MRILGHELQFPVDDIPFCGGAVTIDTIADDDDAVAAFAQRFKDSINAGLKSLDAGASGSRQPIADAPIQTFYYFNPSTRQHVMAWRVACRQHAR
jgi:hypothetical protein